MKSERLSKDRSARSQEAVPVSYPQLYSWGARSLYIGPALNLSAHRNAVAVVAIGLDGYFAVADDPKHPERGATSVRAALIPPNTLHHLASSRGRMAFLYIDAVSRDYSVFEAAAKTRTKRAMFDLACDKTLIALCRDLADGRIEIAAVKNRLERIISGEGKQIDRKLLPAIRHLNKHASERPLLQTLANIAGLSASRFRHAFKEATGVPLRRYRVWVVMGAAVRCLGSGKSLTDAALESGFSSSAHFSSAFREMFGLEPSRLIKAGFRRVVLPA